MKNKIRKTDKFLLVTLIGLIFAFTATADYANFQASTQGQSDIIADWNEANGLNNNGQVVDTKCSGSNYLAGDGGCNTDSIEDNQDLNEVLNDGSDAGNGNINYVNDLRWTDSSGNDVVGYMNDNQQLSFIQKSGTINGVEIDAGALDLNTNNINNIGGLQNCGDDQFVDGNGNCQTPASGTSLSGGDGISPGTINDGDTVSVAWSNANDLNSDGDVVANKIDVNEISGISNQNALVFENGDSRVTNHDGNGNLNIKTGVDQNNDIVAGQGGTHIRMDESGGIDIEVDESTSTGNSMGEDVGLSLNNNAVDIRDASLDMNGGSINSIGGLQSCGNNQYVGGDGNCKNDAVEPDDQGIDDVLNQDNQASNKLDMSSGKLVVPTGDVY